MANGFPVIVPMLTLELFLTFFLRKNVIVDNFWNAVALVYYLEIVARCPKKLMFEYINEFIYWNIFFILHA